MPRKQKLGVEEKIKIIRDYLKGQISISEAARRGKVSGETVNQWIRNYEADGVDAFLSRKNHVYRPELKRQAVEDYLSGIGSLADICRKYHIGNRAQLRDWIKVYNAHGDFNSVKHSGGGSYMKQGRETTQEERIQIVKDCIASGKNYGEMALKCQVSYQQVRSWTLRLNRWEKQDWRIGGAAGRKTKLLAPNWKKPKLKLSNSSTSYIWRKWRMHC